MKRLVSIILVCACTLFALAACSSGGTTAASNSGESSSSEPTEITNDEYITAVAQGLEARWAYSDAEYTAVSKKMIEDYRARVQCEQDAIAQFEGREFEDKALAEKAEIYKKALEDCQEALKAGEVSADLFNSKWNPAFISRATVLEVFVNDYGLTVSDDYKYYLEDVLNNVPHLTFVDQAVGEHSYGYIHTTFTVRNDGTEPINNISVLVQELDESGNILSTTGPGDSTVVQPGQSVTVQGVHPEGTASVQVYGFRYFNGIDTNGNYVEGLFSDVPSLSLQ